MEKKEKTQKPLYKKWWFWLIALCLLGAVGNGLSNGNSPTSDVVDTPNISLPAESELPESTPAESDPAGSSPTESDPVESSTPPEKTGNFLIDSNMVVCPVLNGSGTEVIGQRAYISISSDQLSEITSDFLVEFAQTRVENSGYNWVSIITNNGNGIIFTGSDIIFPTYGKLDEDGSLKESIGYLQLSDGVYTYSEG